MSSEAVCLHKHIMRTCPGFSIWHVWLAFLQQDVLPYLPRARWIIRHNGLDAISGPLGPEIFPLAYNAHNMEDTLIAIEPAIGYPGHNRASASYRYSDLDTLESCLMRLMNVAGCVGEIIRSGLDIGIKRHHHVESVGSKCKPLNSFDVIRGRLAVI